MPKQFLHICNPGTPSHAAVTNIYSYAEVLKLAEEDETVYLVQVHLTWEGKKLSSDYGFEIANRLRTEKKSKMPIIFYSPVTVNYFERKSRSNNMYKLLFGRGSYFLEAPFSLEDLNRVANLVRPLSATALHDVATMLCDLKGMVIDKLNHDLKFEKNVDEVIARITPYLSPLQKNQIRLDQFAAELNENVSAGDLQAFLKTKDRLILLCNQELTANEKTATLPAGKKAQVLMLDDVPEELERAKLFLSDKFSVIATTSGEDAIQKLKEDKANNILAVILDWRLFADEKQNYWQPIQGYEVLEFAAGNGIRQLFAVTSQAEFIINQLRNITPIRFSLFNKQNLRTEANWATFKNTLSEACREIEEVIVSQPNSLQWTSRERKKKQFSKSLKELYAEMRSMNTLFFQEVEQAADELMMLYQNKKNFRYILGTLSTTVIDIAALKEVLIQRRLWIGMYLSGEDGEQIFHYLTKTPQREQTPQDLTQLKNKLCIVEGNVKSRKVLVEEKAWLHKWNL